MKTKTFTFLAGLALVTAAQAGTPVNTPAPDTGLWEWFAGGSAGWLIDMEEGMYGLQLGMRYQSPGARGTHAVFLEAAFTAGDEDYAFIPAPGVVGGRTEEASIDVDIIPITLNYLYQMELTERLDFFAGIGVGVAIVDSSYEWSWSQVVAPPAPSSGGGHDDETDVRFYGDVFAGLSYEASDDFELYAGVRWILMDEMDQDIDVTGASDYEMGISGDVLIELGARYRF